MICRCFIALGLFFVAASARADGPALVQPGALTWGASVTFTPFEYIDNGKPSGFDVDLAELLAKKIGLTSNLVSMEFKGLIPALMGRRIDVIISGMYENAQRKEVADFVSYILVGNQIVVRKGNPLKITGKTDLCGHRVAAPVGTVFETSAKQISEACKAAGKAEISMLTLAGTSTCALALVQDRADAIIVSTPTLAGLQKSRRMRTTRAARRSTTRPRWGSRC